MWSRSCRSAEIRARTLLGPPRLDVLLELVDLVVQVVDQVEVALGDLVDEAEEVHADGLVGLARVPGGARCRTGARPAASS